MDKGVASCLLIGASGCSCATISQRSCICLMHAVHASPSYNCTSGCYLDNTPLQPPDIPTQLLETEYCEYLCWQSGVCFHLHQMSQQINQCLQGLAYHAAIIPTSSQQHTATLLEERDIRLQGGLGCSSVENAFDAAAGREHYLNFPVLRCYLLDDDSHWLYISNSFYIHFHWGGLRRPCT